MIFHASDDWRPHAACADDDPDRWVFVPNMSRDRDVERVATLKAICAECPVRVQCLDSELANMTLGNKSIGIFGGTTSKERANMLKGRLVAPLKHGTPYGYFKHYRHPDVFGPPSTCPDCLRAKADYEQERKTRKERIVAGVADWVQRDHPAVEGGAA